MSQFETNQQLAKCGLSSQDLSARSPFDQSYLQQYNTLSQNAIAYPSDNVKNMPRLSPFEQNVRENYARALHTQVKNLPNTYSQCMGCHSIHNAEQNRSSFDQQYLDRYNTLAKNATAYPAMHPNKNPPLSPFMPCEAPMDKHCPRHLAPAHLAPGLRPAHLSGGKHHSAPHHSTEGFTSTCEPIRYRGTQPACGGQIPHGAKYVPGYDQVPVKCSEHTGEDCMSGTRLLYEDVDGERHRVDCCHIVDNS
jgi:hypothetical protein